MVLALPYDYLVLHKKKIALPPSVRSGKAIFHRSFPMHFHLATRIRSGQCPGSDVDRISKSDLFRKTHFGVWLSRTAYGKASGSVRNVLWQ
jgi:hypothetical protein